MVIPCFLASATTSLTGIVLGSDRMNAALLCAGFAVADVFFAGALGVERFALP